MLGERLQPRQPDVMHFKYGRQLTWLDSCDGDATRARSRELFKSTRAMVEPHVLVQCAQSAAEHAVRLKCLMGQVAITSTAKRRAHDLETNAYRMELEAKACLLRRWQGRRQSPPCPRIAEPLMSKMPYLDARALATHLRNVPEGTVRWASLLRPYQR